MEKEKVNRWHLTIEKEVPSNIFERPVISARITELMYEYKDAIDERIKEITRDIDLKPCYELSHEFLTALFKSYFCNHIANEAVHMAFMERETYDIEKNIIQLLTKGQLRAAIYGKPMIDAFSRAVRILSMHKSDAGYNENALLYSDTILTLRERYLSTAKQKNRCGECGCSCTCDAGCKGDHSKCTSPVECFHHCGCFISPMIENMPDKNRTVQCHAKHNENCDE